MRQRMAAVAVAIAFSTVGILGQQQGQISGTAKDQAKEPYPEYSVRVRNMTEGPNFGMIAGTATLDNTGAFAVANLPVAKYDVELLNKDGKVVCTEHSFDLNERLIRDGVIIDCNKMPLAFWLLGAGAAAGVTAGVVAAQDSASPSR